MYTWTSKKILKIENLSNFVTDPVSEKQYHRKFYWVRYSLIPLFIMLLVSFFIGNHTFIAISATSILGVGAIFMMLQSGTPATCCTCQNLMTRHSYTNGKVGYSNGSVFICYNCNTKFIYSYPDNSPA